MLCPGTEGDPRVDYEGNFYYAQTEVLDELCKTQGEGSAFVLTNAKNPDRVHLHPRQTIFHRGSSARSQLIERRYGLLSLYGYLQGDGRRGSGISWHASLFQWLLRSVL